LRFLTLDFETSGLDHKTHAPVSLGVALMEGSDVVDSKEWLLAPPTDKNGKITREYAVNALEISSYTWPQIKRDGMPIAAVMAELTGFAAAHNAHGLTVVAFNAPFDLGWYSECLFLSGSWNQHLRRFETFVPPLVGPWQCARLLAVTSGLGLERYDLDTVARHFGLSRSTEKHGALEDAILAGRIYSALRLEKVAA